MNNKSTFGTIDIFKTDFDNNSNNNYGIDCETGEPMKSPIERLTAEDSKTYYLDNAATTEPSKQCLYSMNEMSKKFWHNPSSTHTPGITANRKMSEYKNEIGKMLNVDSDHLFFTSGATEANNWAIKSTKINSSKNAILVSPTEHPSVIGPCQEMIKRGFSLRFVHITTAGAIDMKYLESQLSDGRVALVCIMRVNNETGVINDISSISKIAHQYGAKVLCDATQAISKIDNGDISSYDADFVSFSAHKFHGPKGIGCLYIKNDEDMTPFITGGSQQNHMRAGTESLPLVAGMCAALKESLLKENRNRIRYDAFYEALISNLSSLIGDYANGHKISKPLFIINGEKANRINSILSISFLNISGEIMQMMLDEDGIYVSTGSACCSGEKQASHVLLAMNVSPEYINGTIRISACDNIGITRAPYYIAHEIFNIFVKIFELNT